MSSKVMVKVLRPFEGEEGWKDENSEPFEVSRSRFSDLKANGLAEEFKGEVAAPVAEVKMAAEPLNKMAPAAKSKAAD